MLPGIFYYLRPVQRLFEGGAYSKGSYHKDKTFWLYNVIYKYYTVKKIKGP